MEFIGKWKIKTFVCVTPDGMAIIEEHPWKKEGETYFYHTGMEGDVGGEEIDPYEALEPDEEGCLPMMGGMLIIEKI